MRPKDGRALSSGDENQQDQDLADIAVEIGDLLRNVLTSPNEPNELIQESKTTSEPKSPRDSYHFYPVDLVHRLDRLTVARHEVERRGARVSASLSEEIRQTVHELNETRPPRSGDTLAGATLVGRRTN